ncbi:hypothetical protein [Vibrio sp. Isolate24]|uniref:hypothetical protein n=1 Tax=Vibrio sp. Isolate24 TaxID=2908534 RepID=UPI001EFED1AC|nr:hypothetical protein [Vibrio sp. Isolate24]MCG9677369.1 hypothetical protein [Vibrio sp. Isolate24]
MLSNNTLFKAALVTVCLSLVGCNLGSSDDASQGNLSLNVEEVWDAEKNMTYDISAVNTGEEGPITWSVSNESILEISSVSQDGSSIKLKALDYGTAKVVASSDNGHTAESTLVVEGLTEQVFAITSEGITTSADASGNVDSFATFAFTMPHHSGLLNAKIAFKVEGTIDEAGSYVDGLGKFEPLSSEGSQNGIVWTGESEGYVLLYAKSDNPGELFHGVTEEGELKLGSISLKLPQGAEQSAELTITEVKMAGVNELINVHQFEPFVVTDSASPQ